MLLYLWGSFAHCPLKVYFVAVRIVALSEFPRIFAYIRVEICAFWSTSIFRVLVDWYCRAGVFGLIGCTSLSLSLALPTFFNNNNINLL